MAEHTILLVDRDTALCEQIRTALLPFGCRAVALADANDVLSYPLVPSLIVLCIDPKRVGWANAMRIKKHPVLRGVPLILVSAEATEKDFEDHKKLKTRAEEYERKPVAIERLVDKVRTLLGGLEVSVSGEFELPAAGAAGEPIDASDEVQLDDVDVQPIDEFDDDAAVRTRVGSMTDMLHETNAAFAQITSAHGDFGANDAPGPTEVVAAGGALAIVQADEPAPGENEAATAAAAPSAPVSVAETSAAFDVVSGRRALDADERNELDELRSEREHLAREVAELRGRPGERAAAPGPAVSRELLNLREIINRKEKELLELKDTVDAKDREILGVRDRLRESDHARRELDEKMLAVEKDLVAMQERCEALARDKELAHERERGLKSRLEDAQKKLERACAETEEARRRHAADVEAAAQAAEAARRQAAADLARAEQAREEDKAAYETERTILGEAYAADKARVEAQLAEARARTRAAEEELVQLRAQHQQALEQQRQAHQEAIDALRRQAAAEAQRERAEQDEALRAALAADAADKAQALAALAATHESELAARDAERTRIQGEREAVAQQLMTASAQLTAARDELEAERVARQATAHELAEAREELARRAARVSALEADNAAFQDQVVKAYHRIRSDEAVVARARKALAIALTLLDDDNTGTGKAQ